jgi:type IV secretory pathway VirB2 component (pilin)
MTAFGEEYFFMKKDAYELRTYWNAFLILVVAVLVTVLPDVSYAYNSDMGYVMCNAALLFTGNAGRGLATIGISILGVGALLGKVSWGLAIVVGVGIGIIYGASGLVTVIGGDNIYIPGCGVE